MSLENQAAIITGASNGIGRAIAQELSQAGMKVLITGRRAERLQALEKEMDNCVSLAGGIADPDMPAKLLQKALDTFGRCDVVVNNAGVMHTGV